MELWIIKKFREQGPKPTPHRFAPPEALIKVIPFIQE
jgi:hypothetical protein